MQGSVDLDWETHLCIQKNEEYYYFCHFGLFIRNKTNVAVQKIDSSILIFLFKKLILIQNSMN